MTNEDLIVVKSVIKTLVQKAIIEERERIADILEASEAAYHNNYGYEPDTFDWNCTVSKIAEKIRNGN